MTWINHYAPTKESVSKLQRAFHFHPLDAEDVVRLNQYPKLETYPDYLFMVLHFPLYDRVDRVIEPIEFRFFVFKNALITIHNERNEQLSQLLQRINRSPEEQTQLLSENPSALLYEILDALLKNIDPMLAHMSEDLKNVEQRIFRGYEKQMVREILIVKRNIVNMRSIMQSHQQVIKKMMNGTEKLFASTHLQAYYHNLIEHTQDIWSILENQKETVEALQETNESLISFRLNDIMKLLTGLSVVMLPVSLIAFILSMNTPMPFLQDNPDSFWIVLGIMCSVALLLVWYFRKRDWL